MTDAARGGPKYNERRWHTHEGDLIVHGGRTYAMSNQWGRRWAERMARLKESYPELGLEWKPSAEDAGS